MAGTRTGLSGKVRLGVAAVAAATVFGVLYVTLADKGNQAVAAECRPAVERAQALDPAIGGELAAFRVSERPAKLSGLAFRGPDDAPLTLAAFKGKVTLLNLWATWCAPCRQEMPSLDRLSAALGGDRFAVVPVSIDVGDKARPAEFLQSIGVEHLPLYTDRSTEIFESLKREQLAVGLPVTLLLDANGCSLGHINGPAEWDSQDGRRLVEAAIESGA